MHTNTNEHERARTKTVATQTEFTKHIMSATKQTYTITESGEFRCQDPVCYVTQCASCERKQRAAKKGEVSRMKPQSSVTKKQVEAVHTSQDDKISIRFRFDMTGARLDDDEEEFSESDWPPRMRMQCGARVMATGFDSDCGDERIVEGVLRGFAGVQQNAPAESGIGSARVFRVTKYFIECGERKALLSFSTKDFTVSEVVADDGDAGGAKGNTRSFTSCGLTQEAKNAMIATVLKPNNDEPAKTVTADTPVATAAVSKAEDDGGNTNWTHQSRMVLFGWVAKLNPFKAPRGTSDDAWNHLADEVCKSTNHLTKKQGRIELRGNALRVYVHKQFGKDSKYMDYKAEVRKETTQSGQTGLLNSHQQAEYALLDQLFAMRDEANEESVAIKEHKALLQDLKDNQMSDAIVKKAMATEAGQKELLRTLNKKRKKLEIKIEGLKESSKLTREQVVSTRLSADEVQLLKRHEDVKAQARQENRTTTDDGYNSDENANRSSQKKGRFHETLLAMQQVSAKANEPLPESALERCLQQWITRSLQEGSTEAPVQSVESRLAKLSDLKSKSLVTDAEYEAQRTRILESL
jgi:hypothetical protein